MIRGPVLDWGFILYKSGQGLPEHYHGESRVIAC